MHPKAWTGADRPDRARDRILQCHRSDVELYDEVCRLLSAKIETAGEDLNRELHSFRRNNAIDSLLPIYEASGLYRVRRALRRGLEAMR